MTRGRWRMKTNIADMCDGIDKEIYAIPAITCIQWLILTSQPYATAHSPLLLPVYFCYNQCLLSPAVVFCLLYPTVTCLVCSLLISCPLLLTLTSHSCLVPLTPMPTVFSYLHMLFALAWTLAFACTYSLLLLLQLLCSPMPTLTLAHCPLSPVHPVCSPLPSTFVYVSLLIIICTLCP